jgi:hypothetical protein
METTMPAFKVINTFSGEKWDDFSSFGAAKSAVEVKCMDTWDDADHEIHCDDGRKWVWVSGDNAGLPRSKGRRPMKLIDAVKQIESYGLDAKVSVRHYIEEDLEAEFMDFIAMLPVALPALHRYAGLPVAMFSLHHDKIAPDSEKLAARITKELDRLKRDAAERATNAA